MTTTRPPLARVACAAGFAVHRPPSNLCYALANNPKTKRTSDGQSERLPSWVSFFATTMSILVLVTLPTLIATYLPLANAVNHLASK